MEDIETAIRKIVAEHLGVEAEKVTRESKLREDHDADSLNLVEIVMAVEEEYRLEIPDEEAEALVTFGALCDYVASRAPKSITG